MLFPVEQPLLAAALSLTLIGCRAHEPDVSNVGTAASRQHSNVATRPAPHSAGYRVLRWTDEERERPVWVEVWYPTSTEEHSFSYSLGTGRCAPDAPPQKTRMPRWAILSPGAGGDANNYSWLAEALARRGVVVFGVNHFGESRIYGEPTLDPLQLFRWWDRHADIAFVAATAPSDPLFKESVSDVPVGIGHSSGGHTLLTAAGAEPDMALVASYCAEVLAPPSTQVAIRPFDRGCDYSAAMTAEDWARVGAPPSASPARVSFSRLFLMEPALGPSFTPQELQKLDLPVQLVASTPGDFLPYEPHTGWLLKHLPHAEEHLLAKGAGHFSFLTECTLPIYVGDIPLCDDAKGVDRSALHDQLSELAVDFLLTD